MQPVVSDDTAITTLPCHGRKVRYSKLKAQKSAIRCPESGCDNSFHVRPSGSLEKVIHGEVIPAGRSIPDRPGSLGSLTSLAKNALAVAKQATQRVSSSFDLSQWSQQHGITWGEVRQPVPFDVVELREIQIMCSHERFRGRSGDATFVKRALGERFRVCSLADAQKYRELLRRTGRRIEERGYSLGAFTDYDFSGFQCPHCAAGKITGSRDDLVRCGCGVIGCYGSVQPIANGAETYICPNYQCNPYRISGVISGHFNTISAVNLLAVQT